MENRNMNTFVDDKSRNLQVQNWVCWEAPEGNQSVKETWFGTNLGTYIEGFVCV